MPQRGRSESKAQEELQRAEPCAGGLDIQLHADQRNAGTGNDNIVSRARVKRFRRWLDT